MTVFVHFIDKAQTPVKQHNVASVHDHGDSTVVLVNAFGGDPKTFAGVSHLAVEPERA